MKDGKYIFIGDQGLILNHCFQAFTLIIVLRRNNTDRCSGLAVTRFAVAAVMMSQGNQSITLLDLLSPHQAKRRSVRLRI